MSNSGKRLPIPYFLCQPEDMADFRAKLEKPAVRPASIEDAAAIAAIYAEHVRSGTASFDTVARTIPDTEAKIAEITAKGWPFLVAEMHGEILGYAYANQFRDRAAYSFACENSIYIRADCVGQGVGAMLLRALVDAATRSGFRQMVAVIGGGEPASVALHAKLGFEHAGRMRSVGRKFGRWLDTVYMQLELGEGDSAPPAHEPA